jgi:hypothetical protein
MRPGVSAVEAWNPGSLRTTADLLDDMSNPGNRRRYRWRHGPHEGSCHGNNRCCSRFHRRNNCRNEIGGTLGTLVAPGVGTAVGLIAGAAVGGGVAWLSSKSLQTLRDQRIPYK